MKIRGWFGLPLLGILALAGCHMPVSPAPVEPTALALAPAQAPTPSPSPLLTPQPTATPFQPLAVTAAVLPSPTPTPTIPPWARTGGRGGAGIPTAFPNLSDPAVTGPGPVINILLIGADQRSGPVFRTDTLVIASVRPRDDSVALISIPRDLYVYIPGWTMQRINTAYLHGELEKLPGGGPALLKATILYNLGIQIDHIAMVDFNGFRRVVDTLGGIDVPLACPYTDWRIINPKRSPEDQSNWRLYTVEAGVIHMDGDLALWYARSRSKSSDFDRGRRQQEVLRAIYTRGLQMNAIPRLPELYTQARESVTTDLELKDLLALAPLARDMKAPQIRSYYISRELVTSWMTPQGASVLLPKGPKIKALVIKALSPPGGSDVQRVATRVSICNATAHPGWDALAAERLHYAGYETELLDPATCAGHEVGKTMLYDRTVQQNANESATLLAILGLPVSRLHPAPDPAATVAYHLVLGNDYKPCFNPVKLSH